MTHKDNQHITIPVFPLGYLVLPGEKKELHIFEERYKELVSDCLRNNASFGVVLPDKKNKKVSSNGVVVKIIKVLKTSPSGELDILVEGVSVFKTIQYVPVLFPKLYGAATIEFVFGDDKICTRELQNFYKSFLISIEDKNPDFENATIFQLAKKLNLTNEEKMRLLSYADTETKELMLKDKIRLLLYVYEAEKKLKGDFWLN
ncbi:MAG: LON peptidase substrate-binding domain-containing protein [Bacteroidota bacterium]|jgi:Lon protease-like protein